jgi:hypothetical protein
MAFQRKEPAAIGVKAPYPGFMEPALASSPQSRRCQPATAGYSRMISVAAAMIVRDEERFLPGCLSSLRGKVDDVIIVDTGSVDDTLSIATTFGARVFHFEWNDDFAAARNRGLEEVTADWERLHTPGDRHEIKFDGYRVQAAPDHGEVLGVADAADHGGAHGNGFGSDI